MNVLITADTVGGVWTYAVELSRALSRHGVHITLCTMGRFPTSEQFAEAEDIPDIDIRPSEYRLEWMEDPWEDVVRSGDWLLHVEEQIRPDIVHLNGYSHAVLPWHAPVLVVGHSCVLSWWEAVKSRPAPGEWDRYASNVKRGLNKADMVATPTQAMLDALNRQYGVGANSRVIPNGRGPELFQPRVKEPFIFTAGRVWDEAKNIGTLAKAAPKIDWPVCVAGEEEHPDGGSASHENVRLLGSLAPQAMPYWYARAAIYALPARYEPFGLSALEAALAGCALVLGDIPSLREVWGDTAVFIPPDDHEALSKAINELISNKDLRISLANRSRRRALEYSPEQMAEGYLEVYDELLCVVRNA